MAINRQIVLLCVLAILALAACKREQVQQLRTTFYSKDLCGGQPTWSVFGSESGELMAHNHLEVTPSATLWNGVVINRATLNEYLGQVSKLTPRVVTALVVDPEEKCDKVKAIRRVMENRLQCSTERRCVEYSEAEWAKRHPPIS